MEEINVTSALVGAFVVLLILLVMCRWNKRRQGFYVPRVNTLSAGMMHANLPDVHLSSMKNRRSLNELEGLENKSVTRSPMVRNLDPVRARWLPMASASFETPFIAGSDLLTGQVRPLDIVSSYNSLNELATNQKPVVGQHYQSHSSDILTKTDFKA